MNTILKHYVNSLFTAIRKDGGDITQFYEEMQSVCDNIHKETQLGFFVLNRSVPKTVKMQIWSSIQCDTISNRMKALITLLIERKHLHLLPDITHHYKKMMLQEEGITHVTVTIKQEKDATLFHQHIENLIPFAVSITYVVDASILDGFIIKWDDKVVDLSMRTNLQNLHNFVINQ